MRLELIWDRNLFPPHQQLQHAVGAPRTAAHHIFINKRVY